MMGRNTSSPLLYWAEPEKPFITGSWVCLSKTQWWRPVHGGDHSFTPAYQVLRWGPGKVAIRHDVPFLEELIVRWEGETHRPLHCREAPPVYLSYRPSPTSMCLFFPSENLSFQKHQDMNHLLSPVLRLKQYQNTFTHNHYRNKPAKKSSGSF